MNTATDHRDDPLVSPDSVRSWVEQLRPPVAVTGGTGFVGSHLVDTLCSAGHRPRVLVRDPDSPRWIRDKPVDWVAGSLDDRDSLQKLVHGAATVFHLASVVRAVRTEDFDRANRGGTARLVAAIRDHEPSARLVYVSSLAALGPSTVPGGLSPRAKPHPISDYGRSKLAAEQEVCGITGVASWMVVRPPAVYGPRDTDVFSFFRMARLGLLLAPGGERWVTVAYVADVVRGVLAAAVGEARQIYHLGEPKPLRLDELLRAIARAGRVKAQVIKVPSIVVRFAGVGGLGLWKLGSRNVAMTPDKAREIVARHWTSDTRGSMEALGIGDWTEVADGARDTWAWYRKQRWLR